LDAAKGGPGGIAVNQPPDPDLDTTATAREDESNGSVGVWTLVWTLVVMKIVTIAVVVVAARQAEAGALFAVITWHWLVVLGAILAAPVLFRQRLRKVRARRDALLREEWMVEDEQGSGVPVRTSRLEVPGQDLRVR
jgi:hypothetical protein